MRTHPERRGRGIARSLLGHVIADPRTRSVARVSLETGSMDFFQPARALYASAEFTPCRPFGASVDDPHSVFMTRALSRLAPGGACGAPGPRWLIGVWLSSSSSARTSRR